jgi:hypothetical protein
MFFHRARLAAFHRIEALRLLDKLISISKLYQSQDHDTTEVLAFVSKETQDYHALHYKVDNYIVQELVKERRIIG